MLTHLLYVIKHIELFLFKHISLYFHIFHMLLVKHILLFFFQTILLYFLQNQYMSQSTILLYNKMLFNLASRYYDFLSKTLPSVHTFYSFCISKS